MIYVLKGLQLTVAFILAIIAGVFGIVLRHMNMERDTSQSCGIEPEEVIITEEDLTIEPIVLEPVVIDFDLD